MPPIQELSVVDSVPLEVASPARPAGGSPARNESLLCQVSPPGFVAEAVQSPMSPVLRSTDDVSRPSGFAAMDQYCHGVLRYRWGRPRIPLCCRLT